MLGVMWNQCVGLNYFLWYIIESVVLCKTVEGEEIERRKWEIQCAMTLNHRKHHLVSNSLWNEEAFWEKSQTWSVVWKDTQRNSSSIPTVCSFPASLWQTVQLPLSSLSRVPLPEPRASVLDSGLQHRERARCDWTRCHFTRKHVAGNTGPSIWCPPLGC